MASMKKSDFDPAQPYCPPDCPFLSPRSFLPNTLPFYCDKYETYLTADEKHTNRCARCLGVSRTVAQAGLKLIQDIAPNNPTLPTAFNNLSKTTQKMFVDLLTKTGLKIIASDENIKNADMLLDKIVMTYNKHIQHTGSPEYKKFNALLDKISKDESTLLTKQNQTLLANLFMVLDNSEKSMMNAIFKSPGRLQSFLKQFDHQPKDSNLLKDTRRILYEENEKRLADKQRQTNRQQEIQRANQKKLDIERIQQMREKKLQHLR